jgi:hypothetical protein
MCRGNDRNFHHETSSATTAAQGIHHSEGEPWIGRRSTTNSKGRSLNPSEEGRVIPRSDHGAMGVYHRESLGGRPRGFASPVRMLEWLMRRGGGLVGVAFCCAALLFLASGIFLAYCFFVAENRLLFIFPGMAAKVSIEELAAGSQQYENRWVRVQGELRHPGRFGAILVPAGSAGADKAGSEQAGSEGTRSMRSWKIHPFLHEAPEQLPPPFLELRHLSAGRSRTVSFYEAGIVEVAGRYGRCGAASEGKPCLAVAVMVQPRQFLFVIPIIIYGVIPTVLIAAFFPLYLVGRDIRKSFRRP